MLLQAKNFSRIEFCGLGENLEDLGHRAFLTVPQNVSRKFTQRCPELPKGAGGCPVREKCMPTRWNKDRNDVRFQQVDSSERLNSDYGSEGRSGELNLTNWFSSRWNRPTDISRGRGRSTFLSAQLPRWPSVANQRAGIVLLRAKNEEVVDGKTPIWGLWRAAF